MKTILHAWLGAYHHQAKDFGHDLSRSEFLEKRVIDYLSYGYSLSRLEPVQWRSAAARPHAGSVRRYSFEVKNHSSPIVGDTLDQPITENDARCTLDERFNEVITIQREPMAVGPVRARMIVK